MATTRVRVYVHDHRIAELNMPGGGVWKMTRELTKDTHRIAVASLVPGHGFRTGTLARSGSDHVTPLGIAGNQGTVRFSAPHALWVHDGTSGPIFPTTARYLKIQGFGPTIFARSVRGQRANPFLADALHIAFRQHFG